MCNESLREVYANEAGKEYSRVVQEQLDEDLFNLLKEQEQEEEEDLN